MRDNILPPGYTCNWSEDQVTGGCLSCWQIFSGTHTSTHQKVSIFYYEKSTQTPKNNSQIVNLLKRECQLLTQIRHPLFLKVVEPLQETSTHLLFITEETLGSLNSLFTGQVTTTAACFTELEFRIGMCNIVKALEFLHQRKQLIHRRVNMEAVYLTKDGWKLAALGFSIPIGEREAPNVVTPLISTRAPPEIGNCEVVSETTDTFCIAALLAEIYVGKQWPPNLEDQSEGVRLTIEANLKPKQQDRMKLHQFALSKFFNEEPFLTYKALEKAAENLEDQRLKQMRSNSVTSEDMITSEEKMHKNQALRSSPSRSRSSSAMEHEAVEKSVRWKSKSPTGYTLEDDEIAVLPSETPFYQILGKEYESQVSMSLDLRFLPLLLKIWRNTKFVSPERTCANDVCMCLLFTAFKSNESADEVLAAFKEVSFVDDAYRVEAILACLPEAMQLASNTSWRKFIHDFISQALQKERSSLIQSTCLVAICRMAKDGRNMETSCWPPEVVNEKILTPIGELLEAEANEEVQVFSLMAVQYIYPLVDKVIFTTSFLPTLQSFCCSLSLSKQASVKMMALFQLVDHFCGWIGPSYCGTTLLPAMIPLLVGEAGATLSKAEYQRCCDVCSKMIATIKLKAGDVESPTHVSSMKKFAIYTNYINTALLTPPVSPSAASAKSVVLDYLEAPKIVIPKGAIPEEENIGLVVGEDGHMTTPTEIGVVSLKVQDAELESAEMEVLEGIRRRTLVEHPETGTGPPVVRSCSLSRERTSESIPPLPPPATSSPSMPLKAPLPSSSSHLEPTLIHSTCGMEENMDMGRRDSGIERSPGQRRILMDGIHGKENPRLSISSSGTVNSVSLPLQQLVSQKNAAADGREEAKDGKERRREGLKKNGSRGENFLVVEEERNVYEDTHSNQGNKEDEEDASSPMVTRGSSAASGHSAHDEKGEGNRVCGREDEDRVKDEDLFEEMEEYYEDELMEDGGNIKFVEGEPRESSPPDEEVAAATMQESESKASFKERQMKLDVLFETREIWEPCMQDKIASSLLLQSFVRGQKARERVGKRWAALRKLQRPIKKWAQKRLWAREVERRIDQIKQVARAQNPSNARNELLNSSANPLKYNGDFCSFDDFPCDDNKKGAEEVMSPRSVGVVVVDPKTDGGGGEGGKKRKSTRRKRSADALPRQESNHTTSSGKSTKGEKKFTPNLEVKERPEIEVAELPELALTVVSDCIQSIAVEVMHFGSPQAVLDLIYDKASKRASSSSHHSGEEEEESSSYDDDDSSSTIPRLKDREQNLALPSSGYVLPGDDRKSPRSVRDKAGKEDGRSPRSRQDYVDHPCSPHSASAAAKSEAREMDEWETPADDEAPIMCLSNTHNPPRVGASATSSTSIPMLPPPPTAVKIDVTEVEVIVQEISFRPPWPSITISDEANSVYRKKSTEMPKIKVYDNSPTRLERDVDALLHVMPDDVVDDDECEVLLGMPLGSERGNNDNGERGTTGVGVHRAERKFSCSSSSAGSVSPVRPMRSSVLTTEVIPHFMPSEDPDLSSSQDGSAHHQPHADAADASPLVITTMGEPTFQTVHFDASSQVSCVSGLTNSAPSVGRTLSPAPGDEPHPEQYPHDDSGDEKEEEGDPGPVGAPNTGVPTLSATTSSLDAHAEVHAHESTVEKNDDEDEDNDEKEREREDEEALSRPRKDIPQPPEPPLARGPMPSPPEPPLITREATTPYLRLHMRSDSITTPMQKDEKGDAAPTPTYLTNNTNGTMGDSLEKKDFTFPSPRCWDNDHDGDNASYCSSDALDVPEEGFISQPSGGHEGLSINRLAAIPLVSKIGGVSLRKSMESSDSKSLLALGRGGGGRSSAGSPIESEPTPSLSSKAMPKGIEAATTSGSPQSEGGVGSGRGLVAPTLGSSVPVGSHAPYPVDVRSSLQSVSASTTDDDRGGAGTGSAVLERKNGVIMEAAHGGSNKLHHHLPPPRSPQEYHSGVFFTDAHSSTPASPEELLNTAYGSEVDDLLKTVVDPFSDGEEPFTPQSSLGCNTTPLLFRSLSQSQQVDHILSKTNLWNTTKSVSFDEEQMESAIHKYKSAAFDLATTAEKIEDALGLEKVGITTPHHAGGVLLSGSAGKSYSNVDMNKADGEN